MDKIIITKLTSGRYFATVMFVGSYCFVVVLCAIMAIYQKMALETFLGIFSGFSAIGMKIVDGYFNREDRKPEGDNNHEEVHRNDSPVVPPEVNPNPSDPSING